jgi:hypothetical protein
MGCNCKKKNVVSRMVDKIQETVTTITVTDATFNERMNTCQKCTFYSSASMSPRCLQCGCFLDAKARLTDATCPLGKW